MNKFKFRTISSNLFVFTLIAILFSSLVIAIYFAKALNNLHLQIGLTIILISAFFVAKKLTKGIIEIILTDNEIEIKWLKKAKFTSFKEKSIKISELESWRFMENWNFDVLRLNTLTDKIKIERDSSWDREKDDFGKFLIKINTIIEAENIRRNQSNLPLITDKEKEFYKSLNGKLLFYFFIFLTIAGIAILIIALSQGKMNYRIFSLVLAILGGIFYISKHLRMNK